MAEGLTLQEMRDLVRQGLGGLTEEDISDPQVDQFLNMSYWFVESRFPFDEKQFRSDFTLVAGQGVYDIDTFINIPNDVVLDAFQSLGMFGDPDSDDQFMSYPMQRMTESFYDKIRLTRTDAQERPAYYLRRDSDLVFFPIPDKAYTCSVFMLKTLKSLLYRVVDSPNLPREWHEIVVEGAIERGHFYQQDYNLQQQAANSTTGKIRSAVPKENLAEEDSHYAGLVVQWSDPGEQVDDVNIAPDDPFIRSSFAFWLPGTRGRQR
jgi:hypothetical protein